jgi:hypothetical protein
MTKIKVEFEIKKLQIVYFEHVLNGDFQFAHSFRTKLFKWEMFYDN